MVTVSHIVEKIIIDKPLLQEALIEGIVNYAALAEYLHEEIEKEIGKKVKQSAIVMAIRRNADKLDPIHKKIDFKIESNIIMRTGLIDFTVRKNSVLFEKLEKIRKLVDYHKGDTLNILHGNYETAIIINEKYNEKLLKLLEGIVIEHVEEDLVSLAIKVSEEFMNTPGVLASITRKIAWENINIYEMISTLTEVNIIVNKEDAMKCYKALQKLMHNPSKKKGRSTTR